MCSRLNYVLDACFIPRASPRPALINSAAPACLHFDGIQIATGTYEVQLPTPSFLRLALTHCPQGPRVSTTLQSTMKTLLSAMVLAVVLMSGPLASSAQGEELRQALSHHNVPAQMPAADLCSHLSAESIHW